MAANLDLNSYKVVNVLDGTNDQDAVTLSQLNAASVVVSTIAAAAVTLADAGGNYTATTVEAALAEAAAAWLANLVEDTTPQLGGALDANSKVINMGDYAINRPVLTDFSITSTAPSSSSGVLALDLENGNAFQTTLTENVTSVTISNPPASGTFGECIIKFIQDGTGSRTVGGWPAGVTWPGGTAPTITVTATTGVDIVTLKTWDGGTIWYADFSQDYS